MAREQFELSETHSKLLTALMKECGLPTKKAALENALTILAWAVKERKSGRSIAAVDEAKKVYRELTMPALEAVKPSEPNKAAVAG